tara:strand:- start:2541 stop:3392 length:852 start_codon:yes stop_codon:yes gene_type:complete
MFTQASLESETIDGERYTTFQPNTIVYAIPKMSELEQRIKAAKIGVVWHTSYTGNTLEGMKASFGVNISSLRKSRSVWMDDASYRDTSGTSTFTQTETSAVTTKLSECGRIFKKINSAQLNNFLKFQNGFSGKMVGANIKTYNNSKVKVGAKITNVSGHVSGYAKWVEDKFDTEINKLKTEQSQKKLEIKKKETLRELNQYTALLINVINFQNSMVDAKMIIVSKLNRVKQLMDTFVRTKQGFKVTNPEGYVAIDRVSGNAVKLVDRMEFSYNNFTAIKAWDR